MLGLHNIAGGFLRDRRTGHNRLHSLVGLLRQSVFGRLAGYDDVNDADRLSLDPVMRQVVGGRAVDAEAASASQMGQGRCLWRMVRISPAAPLNPVKRENILICAVCHFKVNKPEYSRQNRNEPTSKAALYRFKWRAHKSSCPYLGNRKTRVA